MADVRIENLSKTYATQASDVHALDSINLAVDSREFITILGPSGCGKTTLLKIVAGLIPRSSGSIRIGDRAVEGPGPERAMVFQSFALMPWANVMDNVAFGLKMKGVGRDERYAASQKVIDLVGLQGFEKSLPRQLSGGMQQRVGLARALVIEPSVLLMDEPFSALDEQTRRYMQDELLKTWEARPTTVIFVTHSIEEAVKLGDRVILLSPRPGRIHAVYDVGLPRPRTDAEENPRFGALVSELWSEIKEMNTIGL